MKFIFSFLFVCFLSTAAFGHCGSCGVGPSGEPKETQDHAHTEEHDHKHDEKKEDAFKGMLGLTAEQFKKVENIQLKYNKDYKKLKKKYKKNLRKVLTKEQLKIYLDHHPH